MYLNKIEITVICITLLFIGILGTLSFQELNNKRILNGMYIYNSENEVSAREDAKLLDKRGDWVCINVAYKMTPEKAYETCVHECSHKAFSEIYAEKCEAEPLTCLEALYE